MPPRRLQSANQPERVFVVGRGNLGRSLVRALRAAGHLATAVPGRDGFERPPASGLVFLAVPDSAVTEVAARTAAQQPSRRAGFVHLSGALGLGALKALSGDHAVGSFHPLQSFPRPRPPKAFQGIVVAVDATSPALRRRLERLARDLGAHPRVVRDADRAVYHAAAVFASNFVIALVDESIGLLEEIGWDRREAAQGLKPLMELALQGALERGPVAALTGPIRRGDVDTVRRHLEVLAELDSRPGAETRRLDVYRMLASITLRIAQEAGLEPAAAEPIARALTRDVAATRRRRQR